ncbi:hypothetical protein EDB80DRAFT_893795 [Ilyonectria destructans]|nr:hypothetical protein EDB80DRAFT_893795 [Ilyonectria destructans]
MSHQVRYPRVRRDDSTSLGETIMSNRQIRIAGRELGSRQASLNEAAIELLLSSLLAVLVRAQLLHLRDDQTAGSLDQWVECRGRGQKVVRDDESHCGEMGVLDGRNYQRSGGSILSDIGLGLGGVGVEAVGWERQKTWRQDLMSLQHHLDENDRVGYADDEFALLRSVSDQLMAIFSNEAKMGSTMCPLEVNSYCPTQRLEQTVNRSTHFSTNSNNMSDRGQSLLPGEAS